ncbi:hypothetical protein FBEOM_1847 [Fusarium beomiforme]|uniref:Uncharacterized protein n=1 Tax=Fusarium beomiforme TaxID=44412 RepID=A0A9P5ASK9_9HYPO|nr:hypothetical protein FBEOM_1847 [Fusarium beomiforme]
MDGISILESIRHLVVYSDQAYLNDDGTEFIETFHDSLEGPVDHRFLRIITPVWRDTDPDAVSIITSNTHVHLGIRHGHTIVIAFRGTDFPMTLSNLLNPTRWRGLFSNFYTDICYSLTGLIWADKGDHPLGGPDLSEALVHEGFLLAFNSLLQPTTGC